MASELSRDDAVALLRAVTHELADLRDEVAALEDVTTYHRNCSLGLNGSVPSMRGSAPRCHRLPTFCDQTVTTGRF